MAHNSRVMEDLDLLTLGAEDGDVSPLQDNIYVYIYKDGDVSPLLVCAITI